MTAYAFKLATESWEIEQLHRLNYQAFVEEIPQHAPNPEQRMVDKFHDENSYIIGMNGEQVIAMMAVRANRPFSLDEKLANLDDYLPMGRSVLELRLLYIVPEHRNAKVMKGMLESLAEYGIEHGHDIAILSGTTRQQRFYRHLGCEPFGPLVGKEGAQFQPMLLTLEAAHRQTPWVAALKAQRAADRQNSAASPDRPVNFLPGPVNLSAAVRAAFSAAPISHRSDRFLRDVAVLKQELCVLVNAPNVELVLGSGTLANEIVAAQISLLQGRGLILVNGEFGRRLTDHATRWQLAFDELSIEWGGSFDPARIDEFLAGHTEIEWLWCVHCETSTGVLNDLSALSELCVRHGVGLYLDGVSSIGAAPVDLADVRAATGASGKALASFAGIGLVYYQERPAPQPRRLPRYLDLGYYAASQGVPFTASSNLVEALISAMGQRKPGQLERLYDDAACLRGKLHRRGYAIVASDAVAAPAVTSIELPDGVSSEWVGDRLEAQGYWLSYKSEYLVEKNWLQICLMGDYQVAAIEPLLDCLDAAVAAWPGSQRV